MRTGSSYGSGYGEPPTRPTRAALRGYPRDEPLRSRDGIIQRDRLLARTRAISLGIAGGAVIASAGLGAELAVAASAHAQPASQAATARPAPGQPAGSAGPVQPAAGPAGNGGSPRPGRPALRRAPRPPASAPAAPPQVSSGGS